MSSENIKQTCPEKFQNVRDKFTDNIKSDEEIGAAFTVIQNGKIIYKGKIEENVSEEDGVLAAKLCCINIIAALRNSINGDWDRLDNFVKLGGFVNCKENYQNHPKIINGASDLLVTIFGDQGKHTRFAVGSNSLPMNITVEIDAIIKIK